MGRSSDSSAWRPFRSERAGERRAPILILTGPPGAGKTTAAAALAASHERAAHVESDRFFHFIVSGYVEPWLSESQEQNELVMDLVAHVALGYARAGYFTIVDGIVSPRWFFEPMRDALRRGGAEVAYAILRPPLETCRARTAERADVVAQLWADFDALGPLERHAIDVGGLSPQQVADAVRSRLGDGSLRV